MKDHEIINLFYERSEQAVPELIAKYGSAIHKIASNILKDPMDVEEYCNDTYFAVWSKIPPARPEHLGAWCCRIARNQCLKRYHSDAAQKRNSYYDIALDELIDALPALSTVESEYDCRELTFYLNQFLKSVTREDRFLFLRRYWYGDSISVIAAYLQITPHRASVRLFRLRQRLQKYLQKEGMI